MRQLSPLDAACIGFEPFEPACDVRPQCDGDDIEDADDRRFARPLAERGSDADWRSDMRERADRLEDMRGSWQFERCEDRVDRSHRRDRDDRFERKERFERDERLDRDEF
jgi:hypothetical protein